MRTAIALLAAAGLSLLPTPFARAACPTAADLEATGVVIDFSDGSNVRYARLKPEVVSETTRTADGVENYFSARYRGVFLLLDAALAVDGPDQETLLNFQPSEGDADLPPPAPDMSWVGTVITRHGDGEIANTFEMRIEGAGEENLHIAGCDYASYIIRIEELYEDGDSATELRYLPALGIAYVAAAGAVGADYEFFYVPLLIGAGEPR